MRDDVRHVNLDSRQIRVLAHPLRSRLLSQLRLNGAATATRLADVLGTNTGATSYHLRQLAEVGLVAEDPGTGHGRERWWRSAHDVTSWERDAFAGDPDAQAASDWLTSNFAHQLAERIEDWNRGVAAETPQWRSAAEFSDFILRLGPDQLTAMLGELNAVIERWRAEKPGPDARQILLYLYPVPLPRSEES
jgi:DNA-binding transcriptional ArsR family regulator